MSPTDATSYSEETLFKVRQGLRNGIAGLTDQTAIDLISSMQNEGILFREQADNISIGETSDGYHTFNELYDHRRALTAALAVAYREAWPGQPASAWRSREHNPDDSPIYPGYFIVGIELPSGTITYHYEDRYWDDFRALPELTHAPKWDGAPPSETVTRLIGWARHG